MEAICFVLGLKAKYIRAKTLSALIFNQPGVKTVSNYTTIYFV